MAPLFPGLPGGPESVIVALLIPIVTLLVILFVAYRVAMWGKRVVESAAGVDNEDTQQDS